MIKKALLLAGILVVFPTTKAHPATDNDTTEVVYADTTGIDIDSIEASIDHIELDEVTVEASAWVRKADRNLLFPNAQQIKQSKNGLQLLQKLQIPGIVINPTDNSISLTDKSELSLRINGRPVTEKEIQGISPEQIIRVEYIDNPGIRYGEAGAVLDFIIKTPTSGGSFMGNFTPSLNRGWGQYWTSVKVNTGKSEFSYSGWFAPRWNLEMGRSNTERYELADGSRYVRTEQSQKGSGFEAWHNGHTLNYNFLDPQKQMFNASLNLNNNNYKNKYKGILTDERLGGIENNMYDRTEYISLHPSLNLYYQNNLKKDQLIMANLVTSYETSHSHRLYNENDLATDAPMVNIDNLIKGKTFSVLGEVDYEKTWKNSRFTAGIRHTQSWIQNKYVEQNTIDRMNQGNSYIFGEYWLRLGNHFDGSVGLGYSLYHYAPQNRQSHTYSIWRPRFTARYTIDDYSSLRFNFVRMGSVITLDMLSPVVQDIDGIQQSTGNPDVKPYATYKYELQYQYTRGIFYGKLGAFYTHAPGAIMPEKYWVGDKILSRVDNQKNAEELRFYLNTRINVIPGWLTLSAAPGWHRYWMRGNTYTHTYNNFFIDASIDISHWGFTLNGILQTNFNRFWGETLTGGENVHGIKLSYAYKDWNFGIMVLDPFINNYKVKSENWNHYAGYYRETTTNMIKQLLTLDISWNINWGRKHEAGQQRINNSINSGSVNAAGK